MAQLFAVEVLAISKHLANTYETNELTEAATNSIIETVQKEGNKNVKRNVEYYSFEGVLAVGYRVNSIDAIQG